MQLPDNNYMLFASLCALGFISFMACLEAFRSHKRADSALFGERGAFRAHARIDRMQKPASVSRRETMAVSHTEGFDQRDSWDDDFHKTQLLRSSIPPPPRVSFWRRVWEWLSSWPG